MSEVREVTDPFSLERVQINNSLVSRLRGKYAVGPTMPNGEPEFGWRQMGPSVLIQDEAAERIELLDKALGAAHKVFGAEITTLQEDNKRLRSLLLTARRYVLAYAEDEQNHPQAIGSAMDLCDQINAAIT